MYQKTKKYVFCQQVTVVCCSQDREEEKLQSAVDKLMAQYVCCCFISPSCTFITEIGCDLGFVWSQRNQNAFVDRKGKEMLIDPCDIKKGPGELNTTNNEQEGKPQGLNCTDRWRRRNVRFCLC